MGKFFKVGDRVRVIYLIATGGIYSNIKVGSVGTVKRVIGSNGWSVVFDGYPQYSFSMHADEIELNPLLNVGDRLKNGVVISVGSPRSVVGGRSFINPERGCEIKYDNGICIWDTISSILPKIIQKEQKEDSNMSQFTKKNLKSGMLVVRRDGKKHLIHRTTQGQLFIALQSEGWLYLSDYREDLTIIQSGDEGDIMAIYSRPNSVTNNFLDLSHRTRVWERPTPVTPKPVIKEMTVEQISKALGHEVKIVK